MCVGRFSRLSSVRTVVVYREAPCFFFLPLSDLAPPSALRVSFGETCRQPIGGGQLQSRAMDQSRVPGGVSRRASAGKAKKELHEVRLPSAR